MSINDRWTPVSWLKYDITAGAIRSTFPMPIVGASPIFPITGFVKQDKDVLIKYGFSPDSLMAFARFSPNANWQGNQAPKPAELILA